MLTREREAELRSILRSSTDDPVYVAIMALGQNEIDKAKDALVNADEKEVKTYQGRAQAWQTLLKYLTERPLQSPSKV